MWSEQPFLRNYLAAIHDGQAALFIGAGLSISDKGFVNWKQLLAECADELNLDIHKEHDLVALAQYFVNQQEGGRARLSEIVKNKFEKGGKITKNHRLIAGLPISTIWTTNFDCLLEKALEKAKRTVDVKRRDHDIPKATKGRNVIVYKMHGDITDPGNTVLCKEDYECYASTHHVFQNALEADLTSKTFLFLGFSFSDPNLDYMLGHLRSILKDARRQHYAVIRRVRKDKHIPEKVAEPDFVLNERRQELKIQDLKRYNIESIMIDDYSEVTEILDSLSKGYHRRSVFVSGSADQPGIFDENRLSQLCVELGHRLMDQGFKLLSGLGLNVGSHVVNGALVELYNSGQSSLEQRISLRPFPRNLPDDVKLKDFYERYRRDSIQPCGCVIFVAGRSHHHDISRGVMAEYEIASSSGKICIPIGATGCAARRIWQMLRPQIKSHYHGKVRPEQFEQLNNPRLTNQEILDAVFGILSEVSDYTRVESVRSFRVSGNGLRRSGGLPRRRRARQAT